MKPYQFVFGFLLFAFLLQGCSGSSEGDSDSGPNYLDTLFVEGSYRQSLEALSSDGKIPAGDREMIRSFVRKYRKRIPEGWTYGKILESAKGIKKMRGDAIQLEVLNFMRKEEDLLIQIFMEIKLHNKGDKNVEAVFGDVLFTDSLGKRIHVSPTFLVQGPIAPGASTQLLRLQYAYERPTGNALNDPRMAAMRDTLNMLKAFSKKYDAKQISFRTQDILLEEGITPEDYFLLEGEERKKAAFPAHKQIGLNDWAKKNEALVNQLASRDPSKFLSVRPVLTDGYEIQHGNFLLFDRRNKVVRFFTTQMDVPGRNIDVSSNPGKLESRHLVDFWGWPVELWIYAKNQ